MKRAVIPHFGLILLLLIAHNACGQVAQDLLADAKGPYYGAAGSEILFDASASSGDIAAYSWDFGDGTSESGITVRHSYAQDGSYLLTLKVSDQQGGTDAYSTGVYVKPARILLDVTVQPTRSENKYDYGDVITGVDVKASYPDGRAIVGASLSGRIRGKSALDLNFKETGAGSYHAEVRYPIVKDERTGREEEDFINVSIGAKDPDGRTASTIKMLIRTPGSGSSGPMPILTVQPSTGRFAAGETIELQGLFRRANDGRNMQEGVGGLVLYEDWSGKSFPLERMGNNYASRYRLPLDGDGNSLDYILYAKGLLDGVIYNASNSLHYDVTRDLGLAVVSPVNGTYAPTVKEIILRATYPDERALPDGSLKAVVGGEPIVFERSGDLFRADYPVPANVSRLNIWLFDSLGNGAGATVNLSTNLAQTTEENAPFPVAAAYAAFAAAAVLIALLIVYRFASTGRRKRMQIEKEYEESRQKILSLKAVTKNIMNEFYTRRLSEEDARKRVMETEKEIAAEKLRFKAFEEKLGKKQTDSESKALAEEMKEEMEKKKK